MISVRCRFCHQAITWRHVISTTPEVFDWHDEKGRTYCPSREFGGHMKEHE